MSELLSAFQHSGPAQRLGVEADSAALLSKVKVFPGPVRDVGEAENAFFGTEAARARAGAAVEDEKIAEIVVMPVASPPQPRDGEAQEQGDQRGEMEDQPAHGDLAWSSAARAAVCRPHS